MATAERDVRDRLAKSQEPAGQAIGEPREVHEEAPSDGAPGEALVCTPKALPSRLSSKAASTAYKVNPVNAPMFTPFTQPPGAGIKPLGIERIAVITTRYWGNWGPEPHQLTVSFMESIPSDLRQRIIGHMNAWTKTVGISFVWTKGTGQVRISRGGDGYWSYLGTDILLVPKNRQTMNLQGFTMSTEEREYRRVVRHETGHTLGCPHEHMREEMVSLIDPTKAYDFFWRMYGWDRETVDAQVLTPLDERSLMGTPPDQTSIMCYQLPGSITRDGKPILGGLDINASDFAFMGKIYPKRSTKAAETSGEGEAEGAVLSRDEWDESEDVVDVDVDALYG